MSKLPESLKDPIPRASAERPNPSKINRMLPARKRAEFPELFRTIDPDNLAQVTSLPPGMREEVEDIFGDWIRWERDGAVDPPDPTQAGWLKLRIHPWHKRWTMFQWGPKNRYGEMGWWPTMVFMEEPITGVIPIDLDDPKFDNLKGKMGAFKVPTKADFEDFYKISNRSLFETSWQNLQAVEDPIDKEAADKERVMREYEHDLTSYYSDIDCMRANRFFGGMQGLPFVPQTSLDELERERENNHYVVELRPLQSGGYYKVRTKRTWEIPDGAIRRRVLGPDGRFETIVALIPATTGTTLFDWLSDNGYRVVSEEEEKVLRRQKEYARALESNGVK